MTPATRRRPWLALLLSGALMAQDLTADPAASQTLERALTALSDKTGWNYLLGPGVDLSTPLDQPIADEAALTAWLKKSGLTMTVLESGDRELRRLNTAQVSLAALPITAGAVGGAAATPREGASETTLSAAQINNLGDSRLDQLFTRAANVFGSGEEYYVRGVASGGDLNTLGNAAALVGNAPLAGVVLANLPLSTWDTASAGFERGTRGASVSGPFSSYAGRIQITPVAPQFDNAQALQLGLAELGDTQASVLVNQVLVEQELALRLSLDHQSLAGTLNDPGSDRTVGLGEDYNFSRNTTARAAALWQPASLPQLSLTLDIMAFDGSAGPQRIAALEPFERTGRAPPFRRQQVDGQLASLSADWLADGHGQFTLKVVKSNGDSDLSPTRTLDNDLDPVDLLVDQESDRLNFTELSWQRQWGDTAIAATISGGQNANSQTYLREQRRWTLDSRLRRSSVAISADTALTARWRLQTGLRHNRDQLRRDCVTRPISPTDNNELSSDCLQVFGLLLTPAEGEFEAFSQRYSRNSPELAVLYKGAAGRDYFLRLAEGYNAGGAVSGASFAGQPFWIFYDPERTRSAELGLTTELGTLSLNATAFYTQLDQQWQVVQDFVSLAEVTNTGNSRNQGLELDGRWQIGQDHQLSFSLGWLDTRFENYLPFERDAQLESAAGNQFPGAPKFSGSLNWQSELAGGWQIGAGLSFHDSVEANANNPSLAQIPAAALTDVRIAWRRRGLTLALVARNLFDRQYQQTTPNVIRRNQRIDYLPGRPRNVGLTLNYAF